MSIPEPLTQDELQELVDFLESPDRPESVMDFAMLDGLCTGLMVGPENEPEEWLPEVWNGDESFFEDEAQAARMKFLILRYYLDVGRRIEQEDFRPMLLGTDEQPIEEIQYRVERWCRGFLDAVGLRTEDWAELMEEENIEFMAPFLLLGTEDGLDIVAADERPEERWREMMESLPQAVEAIYRYWSVLLNPVEPMVREGPKVGRNDPCPCGSGRKYKKCCGA